MSISAKLGDVARFVRGITFKPDDVVPNGTSGSVWCMRTKNVQKAIDLSDVWSVDSSLTKRNEQYLQSGDILVSSANSWNLVGKCCWVPDDAAGATFGGFITALRPEPERVHPRYLYHWFAAPRTQTTVRGFSRQTTNIANLDLKRCLGLSVHLPSLQEQERIAQVLDQVESLRAKRHEAIALLDELAQSIFLEMFGKVVPNDRGWQVGRVSDLVAQFSTGKSIAEAESDDPRVRYRILRVSAVTSGYFESAESKPAPVGYEPPDSHMVRDRDLIFSRANTRELIGATALAVNPPSNLLLPDKLWRFEWHDDRPADPLFVRQLFRQREFKREIETRSSGTSGSMKNISQANVLSIPSGIPPRDIQVEYGHRVAAVDQLRVAHQAHLAELDALFASLQDRAFRGELWTEESAPVA